MATNVKHRIVALICADEAWKIALMGHLIERFPTLMPLRVLTTRSRGDPDDSAFYVTDIPFWTLRQDNAAGKMAAYETREGKIYALPRTDVAAALEKADCLLSFTEDGVRQLRGAGITVIAVRVALPGAEDAAPAEGKIKIEHTFLVEGGNPQAFDQAVEDLTRFVTGVIYLEG